MPAQQYALVTGGSSGIGWAVVERLSRSGLAVIVLDQAPLPDPALASLVDVDLGDPQATRGALEAITRETPITRLVNNVGAVRPAPLEDSSMEDFQALMQLNLGSALLCAQALLPAMRTAGFGRIVNISSRAALGKEHRSSYAASKAGLLGFTRTWALELGRSGITVNAVAPGPIATELFTRANPPGDPRTRAIIDAVPVGRMGTAGEVARAVAFFLDDDNGFITGQTLYVCGGMTVGRSAT